MWRRIGWAAVTFVACSFGAEDARACSIKSAPINPQLFVSTVVPANGAVIVRRVCEGECAPELLESIEVRQADTGTTVPGRITARGENPEPATAFVAWKADAELVPGATYHVFDLALPSLVREFYTLPRSGGGSVPEVSAVAQLWRTGIGELGCCPAWPGNCELTHCVPREYHRRPRVRLFWSDSDQLLSWVRWSSANESFTLGPVWGSTFAYGFERADVSYCYEVEFESLIDGERFGPVLDCVEHGELGSVGVGPITSDELEVELAACSEPPPSFEQGWCALYPEEAPCAMTGAASGAAGHEMGGVVRIEGGCFCGLGSRGHGDSRAAFALFTLLGLGAYRRRAFHAVRSRAESPRASSSV